MTSDSRGIAEFIKSFPLETISYYYKQAVDYGLVDVVLHPFDYADTLIRLGYEPFPPVEESSLLRGKSLVLPGVPSYVYYLYSIDGAHGVFRGVVPYVTGNLIYRHLSRYIMNHCPFPLESPEGEPHLCQQFTNANVGSFVHTRFWKLVSNVMAIQVAYPFHVIAVRTMARFVAAAATSDGHRPEINESWIDELQRVKGFDELFAGCQARVIKEITFAVIAGGSFLAIMRILQVLKADPEQGEQLERSAEFLGNSIAGVYINPFRNVSDIMIINKTDIPLGNPPFNKHYNSCWDCCKKLKKDRFWKTSSGGGLFHPGRYYNGEIQRQDGRLYPRKTYFGPVYMPKYAHGMDDIPPMLRSHYNAWDNMGGVFGAGRTGTGDILSFAGESLDNRKTRVGSLALTEIRTTLMSERAPLEILGLGKSFNFYGTSGNPFGL